MEFLGYLIDFIVHIDKHLFELIGQYGAWIYAILFTILFCETGLVVTPFLPGDSLLFATGVAAGAGLMHLPLVLGILFTAGVLGDAVNYCIGHFIGPKIFAKDTFLIKRNHLLKAQEFYEKHGGKAIVLARFVPIVRTFAPFVAGIACMKKRVFFFYNILGCFLWVFGLVSVGYFLGNTPWVKENFSMVVYIIVLLSIMPMIFEFIAAKVKKSEANLTQNQKSKAINKETI